MIKEIGGKIVPTLPKLRGLYYITHVDNVPSIFQRGILSHAEIERQSIHQHYFSKRHIDHTRSHVVFPAYSKD
ncbi:DarT ssDNA thymidine ADP-ribosyltransferase family protein [Thermotoga profunda]|uniref:DarT ssDNA thymidine ADP-ribosyltransferase family protein n=1 Tax=Thermotoga profunda TaxID=1508420 RepID=UPI0038CD5091